MQEGVMGSVRQDDGGIVINSGARLTIDTIADFAKLVKAGLAGASEVAIAFDPGLEADMTAMQLLCSAHRTAATMGKVFGRRGEMPKALRDLVVAAGSERHRFCAYNNGNTCPWFEGES